MFLDRLNRLFSDALAPEAELPDARLAVAELLVHASLIDDDLAPIEAETRDRLLADRFGLGKEAVANLVREAQSAHAEATDYYRMTSAIKQAHDRTEREAIVEMVCEIILADGHLDTEERRLAWRIAGLLGFDNREWITILKRVESRTAQP